MPSPTNSPQAPPLFPRQVYLLPPRPSSPHPPGSLAVVLPIILGGLLLLSILIGIRWYKAHGLPDHPAVGLLAANAKPRRAGVVGAGVRRPCGCGDGGGRLAAERQREGEGEGEGEGLPRYTPVAAAADAGGESGRGNDAVGAGIETGREGMLAVEANTGAEALCPNTVGVAVPPPAYVRVWGA